MAETFNQAAESEREKAKDAKGSNLLVLPTTNIEKKRSLDGALVGLEKAYGRGVVMRLGEKTVDVIPHLSSGLPSLDFDVLGIGGIAKGRIVEIYGQESSGKTSLCLGLIAAAQRNGGMAAFVDVEHALDPTWARKLGVDVDELLVSQPDNAEQALEVVDALVASGALDVIVVDSVAALVPKSELEGDMGQASMGVIARLMSQACRKLTGSIHKTNTIVIFINQLREQIGPFAGPPKPTGGNALKFYASVRLDVKRVEPIKKGGEEGEVVGNKVRIKAIKNKLAPPFKETEVNLYFNEGFSREASLLDSAEKWGIVKKSGTWFSYNDNRLGQGKENVRQHLLENPKLYDTLYTEIAKARDEKNKAIAEEGAARRRKREINPSEGAPSPTGPIIEAEAKVVETDAERVARVSGTTAALVEEAVPEKKPTEKKSAPAKKAEEPKPTPVETPAEPKAEIPPEASFATEDAPETEKQ